MIVRAWLRLRRFWCGLKGHRMVRRTRLVKNLDMVANRVSWQQFETCWCGYRITPPWEPTITLDRPPGAGLDDDVVYRSREER